MSRLPVKSLVLILLLAPAVAQAQGLLIVTDPDQRVRLPRPIIIYPPHPHPHPHPRPPVIIHRPTPPPPARYKIKELEINARLVDQVAKVQVSQTFENTGSRQLEVAFVFPLPYDGAIDQMTLLVDGKEFPAKLLDAKKARSMYEAIVRKNKDPALLEWMGTGLFKTSVFPVPPGAKRTVALRYSQLCRKQDGLTDFIFPLSTAKYTTHAVEKVDIRITIESKADIKNVYSPSHSVKVKRPDDQHATVTLTKKNEVPTTDFRLMYDVGKGKVSTRVVSYRPDKDEDGYFLLLSSPKIKSPGEKPKKTVVFVVDRSGSMSGKKIEQARAALKSVLNGLREGDTFNIVAYDSEVETFRPELQRYDDKTRKAALGFIEGIYAGGSTNIEGALKTTLSQLKDNKRPTYVLFLTDGLPTAGETNEMKIVKNVKEENKVHARIFTFGVGYDVNSRLLDKLVRENYGQAEYVRPNEDIEDRVGRLSRRIESPVLTGVRLQFVFDDAKQEQGKPINRIYPKDSFDLFAGEQLVVVGRYKKPGVAKVVVTGKIGDKKEKFDFPAKLAKRSDNETHAFIEKLWAVRRVGEIIDELDLNGKNKELIEELVKLSKQHGILTPYTSFMADENTNIHDVAANTRRADVRLERLAQSSGAGGFAQRAFKGSMKRAKAAPRAADLAMDAFSAPAAEAPAMRHQAGRGIGAGAAPGGGPGGPRFSRRPAATQPAADRGQVGGYAGDDLAGAVEEAEKAKETVRNIGSRTFYYRDKRWVDSKITKEQEKSPTRIKQFSDEYFALAARFGKKMSQYMVFDEPVLLTLDDKAYLIEP